MNTINWTTIIVAVLTAFPPSFVAYLAWKESKRTHQTINSRMDQLLKSEKSVSKAEGVEQGREEATLQNN